MSAFGFLKPHELPVRLQRLKSLSLFSTLTPRELQIIDGLLHLREYQADEIIFDEGEEGQALYIVLSGVVSVCRNQAASRETLAELAAGSFFGDLALLDNTPRMAQVRARTDCELAVFFCADRIATTVAEKQTLRTQTGADVVEMESAAIHAVCREYGISCATVRVISDTAGEDLPLDFNALAKPDKNLDPRKLFFAIARSPGKIGALMELQKKTSFAARQLAAVLVRVIFP